MVTDMEAMKSGLLLLYASLYLVVFRDATRTAASLGAFEARTRGLFIRKFLLYSIPVLGILPVIGFFLLSILVASAATEDLHPLMLGGTLFSAILFPWVSHHIWCLVARTKVAQGREEGQPGYGWLNSAASPGDLPHPWYSLQVCAAFFLLLALLLIAGLSPRLSDFPYPYLFWSQLFVVVYVSQVIVLFHIGRLRGYFARDARWILSWRTVATVPLTLVLPAIVGALAVYPLASSLDNGTWKWWSPVVFCLFLFFPYWCNQSTLLLARRLRWASQRVSIITSSQPPTEIQEGGSLWWWICFTLDVVCVIILIFLRNSGSPT